MLKSEPFWFEKSTALHVAWCGPYSKHNHFSSLIKSISVFYPARHDAVNRRSALLSLFSGSGANLDACLHAFCKLLGHFLPTLMCCLISRLENQAEWRQGNRTMSVCWYFYCVFKRKVQIYAKLRGDAARLEDEAAQLIPHKYASSYFSHINRV